MHKRLMHAVCMGTYKSRFRHFSNEQLRDAQINQGMLIDRLFESKDKRDKLQIGNARRRYWRILDEMERRKNGNPAR